MFSGINKCSQGRNIFVIDSGSSRYQIFEISLIYISAEFPAYTVSIPFKVQRVVGVTSATRVTLVSCRCDLPTSSGHAIFALESQAVTSISAFIHNVVV